MYGEKRKRENDRGQGMVDTRSPMVHTRVVLERCLNICIRDGLADWKSDRSRSSRKPSSLYIEDILLAANSLAASL